MVLSLERWVSSKAVAVVTGTSSGIGAVIAEQLVKNGFTVVGIARRIERVEELAKKLSGEKGKLVPLKVDISVKDEVIKAFQWIKTNVGPVSILVNNAAVNKHTPADGLITGEYENWKEQVDTNILGLSLSTREAVQQMRDNNINGHIIHINSILGHKIVNTKNLGGYISTKWAVTALAEVLRSELRDAGTKIKITSISPGLVRSEMSATVPEGTKELFKNVPMLNPEDIAAGVLYVLSTPEHVQVHELTIGSTGSVV